MNFKFILFCISSLMMFYSCSSDEDIQVEKDDSLEITKRQRIFKGFTSITPCEAASITYAIDPSCLGSRYADLVDVAIEKYNDAPIGVNFVPFSGKVTESPDLIFNCVNKDNCGEASASVPETPFLPNDSPPDRVTSFPSGGTIGGQIDLGINWSECPCNDPEYCPENATGVLLNNVLIHTIMHEIGHVLGIAHNNASNDISDQLEDTNDNGFDPTSIFNNGNLDRANCVLCTRDAEFNEDDIKVLQELYPPNELTECDCPETQDCTCEGHEIPNFDISFNGPICVGDIIEFTLDNLELNQSLYLQSWSIVGSMQAFHVNSSRALAEAVTSGQAEVCLEVTNSCGNVKEHCINVSVTNCDGGNGNPQ